MHSGARYINLSVANCLDGKVVYTNCTFNMVLCYIQNVPCLTCTECDALPAHPTRPLSAHEILNVMARTDSVLTIERSTAVKEFPTPLSAHNVRRYLGYC